MRILSRYLVREVASFSGGGFLVVLAIFLVTRLNTLLADAAAGTLPGDVVIELLALRAIMALPSLLPATLYIGILLGVSRLARDHEIEALRACGVSPWRQYAAVGAFAFAVAIVIGFLSFTGRPWAAARFKHTQERAIADAHLRDVPLGTFIEVDPESHTVLFAESRSSDSITLENVLLQQPTEDGMRVTVAARAFEATTQAADFRYLNLVDGTEYELDAAGARLNVSDFQQSSLRIALPVPDTDLDLEKTLGFADLWGSHDPAVQAELQWRAAMPVSSLLLVVMAIPLAQAGSGRHRYVSVLPALLLYLVYRTLLGTAKSWVASGTWASFPGVWLIHGGALIIAAAMLAYTFANWRSLTSGLRRGRQSP